jgi:hypothetical protein
MHNSKDYFLSILGVSVPPTMAANLSFQRRNEQKPFCSIITDSKGKTFLRVNPMEDNGVVIIIP